MRLSLLRRTSVLLLAAGLSLAAFSLTFTHFAGSTGGPGYEDGNGIAARFNSDAGIAVDASGNVYVSDAGNYTIRKISASGEVTTLAGLAEAQGFADGHGGNARFWSPRGLAVDGSGTVYVADTTNQALRTVLANGTVSSSFVYVSGVGQYAAPTAVTLDGSGNLYVTDASHHAVIKITGGNATLFAGTYGTYGNANGTGSGASFNSPQGITYDPLTDALYVADAGNNVIRKVTLPGADVTTFAGTMNTPGHYTGVPGRLYSPSGICVDAGGTFYVSDAGDHTVRSITSGGSLGDIAGLSTYPGPQDGNGAAARFTAPGALAVSGGLLYVADSGNHTVRRITLAGSAVTTFAGAANEAGFVNNVVGSSARFRSPAGIAYYPLGLSGLAWVAEPSNNAIRLVSASGQVSTLAGGTWGYAEGLGTAAQFKSPSGVAVRLSDNVVFVADTGNHCIRSVDLAGNTARVAGQPGLPGLVEGDRLTTAKFNSPTAVAINATYSKLYVSDTGNNRVRVIDLGSGVVSTLATSTSFGQLGGLMVDSADNVFVADQASDVVHKITAAGVVTTFAGAWSFTDPPVDGPGTSARFGYPGPSGVSGSWYGTTSHIADPQARLIRTLTFTDAYVGTAGGAAGRTGTSDGTRTLARFLYPRAISSMTGSLAFVDGNSIRLGVPEIADSAQIDSEVGRVGVMRQLDTAPQTATSWVWSIIRRPSGSTAALSSTTIRNPTFTPDVADLYVFRLVAKNSAGISITTVSLQANGAASSLWIGYPGPATAGVPFSFTAGARDSFGNIASDFTGAIHFTASDATATLPADYTFVAGDHGSHTFNATLRHSGAQTISATSTGLTGAATYVYVAPGPISSLSVALPAATGSGDSISGTVTARDAFGNAASYAGTIRFTSTDGAATLPGSYTFTGNSSQTFTGIIFRTAGTQTLTATDIGTASITGSDSIVVGTAPAPTGLTATATSAVLVSLSWTASPGAAQYQVLRSSSGGAFALRTTTASTSITDAASGGITYIYTVRAVDGSARVSSDSLPDVATTIMFTDDSLVAGTTPVRAVHLTQLRQAVAAMRVAAGLAPATFTGAINTSAFVQAVHVLELRTALAEARAAIGLPAIMFADAITPGTTPIRAVHVEQLRNGVK